MVLLNVLAELDGLLAESAGLIDLYEKKESSFYERTLKWINRVEELAANNKWPVLPEVSALRGKLITAARMQAGDSFDWVPQSKNRRRARDGLAAEVIGRVTALMGESFGNDRRLQEEAMNLLRQVVAIGTVKGLIEMKPPGKDTSAYVREGWAALLSDPELSAACGRAVGLAGGYNAFMLFDRAASEIFVCG